MPAYFCFWKRLSITFLKLSLLLTEMDCIASLFITTVFLLFISYRKTTEYVSPTYVISAFPIDSPFIIDIRYSLPSDTFFNTTALLLPMQNDAIKTVKIAAHKSRVTAFRKIVGETFLSVNKYSLIKNAIVLNNTSIIQNFNTDEAEVQYKMVIIYIKAINRNEIERSLC